MPESEPKQTSPVIVAVVTAAATLSAALIAALAGFYTVERQFQAELAAADKQLSGELVSTAVEILIETPDSETEIRKWAREIIVANAGIQMTDEAASQFRGLSKATAPTLLGGETTQVLPLREGTTFSLPHLGIRQIDVQLQESQGTAIARITLVFLNGETDRLTLAEGEEGSAEIASEWGAYSIRLESADLDHRLVLLRFRALSSTGEASAQSAQDGGPSGSDTGK